MKTRFFALAAATLLFATASYAQTAPKASEGSVKIYGFIRNYAIYDSHESNAGTEDLYYYMPNDNDNKGAFNFVALTSRLGFDVTGYEVEGYKVGAKIETDFYNKNGTTAILRLRQAYFTMAKNGRSWKIGQAWHPMAADMPDIYSLETGAPFGPFSRTPQINFESKVSDNTSFTLAAIWQMQYTSTGPDGATANYIKYGGIPELYAGLNIKSGNFLTRFGVDVLSIKPFKANDGRSTTLNAFMYDQYTDANWSIKNKLTFASDGSHFNMIGGYGVCGIDNDGTVEYSPTRNVSDWATFQYKGWGKWRPCILLGYISMFGTPDEIIGAFYKKLNADSVNRMYRIQPEIVYNLGKVAFGLEYMLTSVQYGKADNHMAAVEDLHWVSNNRIQLMAKYTF